MCEQGCDLAFDIFLRVYIKVHIFMCTDMAFSFNLIFYYYYIYDDIYLIIDINIYVESSNRKIVLYIKRKI